MSYHQDNLFRDAAALKLSDLSSAEIVQKSSYMPIEAFNWFSKQMFDHLGFDPRGKGIEVGAGCAALSISCVSAYPRIDEIVALEYAPIIAGIVQRKVFEGLGVKKVVSCCASFDEIPFMDGVFDFAIECNALHHSTNLRATFSEISRVLKPGASAFIIDRVQPDSMSDGEIATLLNARYSQEFLRTHYYPEDLILTRRENGEHEYRRQEWLEAITACDCELIKEAIFIPWSPKSFMLAIIGSVLTKIGLNGRMMPYLAPGQPGYFTYSLSRVLPFLDLESKFVGISSGLHSNYAGRITATCMLLRKNR